MHKGIRKKAMEYGETGDVMERKTSFGLRVADEKIKLIDISSEDDYFLVASPFSDNFLQSASFSEFERMEEKEQESRPSFLRHSLAWDRAFSNNAGVLDPDELSFINNGFINSEVSLLPADHEVRNRKPESESNRNDLDFSANWFDIEPSIFKSQYSKGLNVVKKSPNPRLKQNGHSSNKVDKSCKNEVKFDPAWIGKSTFSQSEGKMKEESTTRRLDKNLTGRPNLNLDHKSVRTGSATAAASSLYKSKTGLNKTQHSLSFRTPKISGHAEKKKGIPDIGASTHSTSSLNHPFCSPTGKFPYTSPVHKQRRSIDANDVKEASRLQSTRNPLSCEIQNGSLSAKGAVRPSGLRPPSPNFRYFDESISAGNQGAVRSRKMPQKVIPEESASTRIAQARKMIRTPRSELAKNVKRAERKKQDVASIDDKAKKELEIICRNLEAVALDCNKTAENGGLKQEQQLLNSALASSRPYQIIQPSTTATAAASTRSRTPLAEKRSNGNSSRASALRMEPKKERLLTRASSVRYG